MATTTLAINTGSTANAASYATGSFTPVAGDLLVVMVWASGTTNTSTTCTASANGITFTRLAGFPAVHTLAGNVSDMWVADKAVPNSPASMTVTWGTGAAGTGAFVSVVRAAGLSKVGTTAVKQIAINKDIAANGAYTATFGSATTTGNPLLGFVASNGGIQATAPGVSPPGSWTELSEPVDQATPPAGIEIASNDAGDTATTYTWTASVATVRANVQAVELDVSTAFLPHPRRVVKRPPWTRRLGHHMSRVLNPKTETLTEDFSASLNSFEWATAGAPVIINGRMQIVPTATYDAIQTVALYDLTASYVICEFIQVPNSSAVNTTMELQIGPADTDSVYVMWFNSTLLFRERVASVNSDTSVAYSATAHRWVRIREAAGTVFWDTSPDAIVWTNRRSKATTLKLTGSKVRLTAGTFGGDTGTGTAIFDNVNLLPSNLLLGPIRRLMRPPLSGRRRKRAEIVPTQAVVTPPSSPVPDVKRAARRLMLPRRDRSVEVTPPQIVVTPPTYKPDPRRAVRRIGLLPRRDRSVEVVSPQVQPPPETARRRGSRLVGRLRPAGRPFVPPSASGPAVLCDTDLTPFLTPDAGLLGADVKYDNDGTPYVVAAGIDVGLDSDVVATPFVLANCGAVIPSRLRRVVRPPSARRRGRVEVVPAQIVVAPPVYRSEMRRLARRIGLLPRRDRSVEITPPQVVVAPPVYRSEMRRAPRRFVMLPRRDRSVEVVPPQVQPPPETARRRLARGFATRRRGRVEVTAPQVVVTPPVYRSEMRRAPRRFVMLPRRNRSVEVTPPQIVVAPPPAVPDTRRRATRGFASLRRRRVEVTPPQVVVTPPTYVPAIPPKRLLRGVPRRGRRADLPPGQLAAPARPGSRRTPPRRNRRRRLEVVPDQPLAPVAPRRRPLRVLVRKLGRTAAGLFAASTTVTLLPDEILTARVYPATLTADTHGGLTARTIPNTLTADTEVGTLTADTLPSTLAKD